MTICMDQGILGERKAYAELLIEDWWHPKNAENLMKYEQSIIIDCVMLV